MSEPTAPHPPRRSVRRAVPYILFGATCVSTFLIGTLSLPLQGETAAQAWDWLLAHPTLLWQPVGYAAGIMGILLAHEMGHYLVARWRGVDQSLPYFIPFPSLFGTMGAVIFMRQMPRTRRHLFDVAIAGPLAGLVLALPLAVYGLTHSTPIDPTQVAGGSGTLWFGNSLLFIALEHVYSPAGDMVTLHPVAFAAWAGLLVTSLNLIPAGQLDGGHIMYAVFGRRVHRLVAIFVIAAMFGLGLRYAYQIDSVTTDGAIWLLWGAMLFFMGRRHPPVQDEAEPLDTKRRVLAAVMLLVFVLTFIPLPVQQCQ